jgi:RNA polymerase sigma-70 factor, ECF subfamily
MAGPNNEANQRTPVSGGHHGNNGESERLNRAFLAVSDDVLLENMAKGEQSSAAADALSELYVRYGALMFAIALRIVRSQSESEDLVHDVFLEVWKNAASYDPARGRVRTWLTVRMRSRALDVLKSARVARNAGADALASVVEHSSTSDVYAESHLHRGLESLSDDHRRALEGAFFDGLSCSEIAVRDGIPLGTVKSRTAHALAKLRTVFEMEKGGR